LVRSELVPDAVLIGNGPPTCIDFVGAYSANKLRSIIERYTAQKVRYQLW
jgi:hypothetical protein